MSSLRSDFSDGVIHAISRSGTDRNDLWCGFFDFALFGASWDKRSTAITVCENVKFKIAIGITPFEDVPNKSLKENSSLISEYCLARSEKFYPMQSKTSSLAETLAEVRAHFWTAIYEENYGRPARVFIDVTTCPRYFSLAILAEALRSGLVGEVVIGYSEGAYPEPVPSYENLEDISFTDGAFVSVPVPGYFGEFEPNKSVFYFISTGFDGWKTLNLLVRKEPERVAALIASPGVRPDYERRAIVANKALFQRFGITDDLSVKAPAGDAVHAWRSISEANLEKFDSENIYYLCSGNKAHSVALALRAIVKGVPTLLYNRPSKHLPSAVDYSGVFWAYSVVPETGTVFGK